MKHLAYNLIILSSMLKCVQYRGKEIIETIFNSLKENDGLFLLPHDYKAIYERSIGEKKKNRTLSDFIAGMTDRYAFEYYSRLKSENASTIFKPL